MSHDRGCFKCGEDRPYTTCPRSDCPKRDTAFRTTTRIKPPALDIVDDRSKVPLMPPDRFHNPKPGLTVEKIETRPVCHACQREQPLWGNCFRYAKDCPVRAAYAPGRPDTQIIAVSEPGYEIIMFFNADGGAQAIVSRPGGKEPIDFQIAPPLPNRRIVVERKGATFKVVYRDAP